MKTLIKIMRFLSLFIAPLLWFWVIPKILFQMFGKEVFSVYVVIIILVAALAPLVKMLWDDGLQYLFGAMWEYANPPDKRKKKDVDSVADIQKCEFCGKQATEKEWYCAECMERIVDNLSRVAPYTIILDGDGRPQVVDTDELPLPDGGG